MANPDRADANPERARLRMNHVNCESDGVSTTVVDTEESTRYEEHPI
jgi:hypothetical protein